MSLHNKIFNIKVFSNNSEPAYEGYFQYIYMNDGTNKRFVNIDGGRIAYEVGGKVPYGETTETECVVDTPQRINVFNKRKLL